MSVSLRDGRVILGVLRSYDQFHNILLSDSVERLFASPANNSGDQSQKNELKALPYAQWPSYADVPRGNYLVRGENIVIIGEVDEEAEIEAPLKGPIDKKALLQLKKEYAAQSSHAQHSTSLLWDDADLLWTVDQ